MKAQTLIELEIAYSLAGEQGHCPEVRELIEDYKQLQSENKKQYREGYEAGLRAFAWWKNGTQYVGSCGTTLKEALNK